MLRFVVGTAACAGIAAFVACVGTEGLSEPAPVVGAPDAGDGALETGPRDPDCDASFCDDFDDGVVGARWSGVELMGGVLTHDQGALYVRLPVFPSLASLVLDAGADARRSLTCSFRIRVEAPFDAGHFDVLSIRPRGDTAGVETYALNLAVTPTTAYVRDDVTWIDGGTAWPRRETLVTVPIDLTQWSTFELRVDFATTQATLRINDAVVAQPPLVELHPDNVTLMFGGRSGSALSGRPTTSLRLDAFRCSFER